MGHLHMSRGHSGDMLQEGSDLGREQLASFLAVPCNRWTAVSRWVHGCLSPGQDPGGLRGYEP